MSAYFASDVYDSLYIVQNFEPEDYRSRLQGEEWGLELLQNSFQSFVGPIALVWLYLFRREL